MAADSKTEQATPRKREKAREEGRVATSRDLTAGLSLLAACLAARMCWDRGSQELARAGEWTVRIAGTGRFDEGVLNGLVRAWENVAVHAVLPIVGSGALVGLIVGVLQTRMMFSVKSLQPKLDKLSPVNGFKRIISIRGLVEGAKNLLKVVLILGMASWVIWGRREDFARLSDCSMHSAIALSLELVFLMVQRCAILLVTLGVADYAYQWWEHERSLRMSRQEIIQEMRESEGDPHIKARRKALRRSLVEQGISGEMRDADVVVTNPTHLAVALLYKPGMPAPKVVAKGRHLLAERIVGIARQNRTPIIQNVQVARELYKTTHVGRYVPGSSYQAVAEILALIYRQVQERRARQAIYYA